MIVKNEAHVIRRCLDSVKKHIDTWVIVDTGSTDGTQEIIKSYLKDIPGELHERPWVNFGVNRNEALELARNKADYFLFIDADDWLEFEEGANFENLDKDLYHMWRGTKDFQYIFPQIAKASLPWKWVGVLHEYLSLDAPYIADTMTNVKYVSGYDGASHYDPGKYKKYLGLLEQGLKEEPNNERYVFYLAETHRDGGEPVKAIENYFRRITMGGWDEEIFHCYLQIAKLKEKMGLPEEIVVESYLKAHRQKPYRPEPVYYLSNYWNKHQKFDLAYEMIHGWKKLPKNKRDILFNEDWTARWGIDFELSLAAYYLKQQEEFLSLCDKVLKSDIPKNIESQVIVNKGFPAYS